MTDRPLLQPKVTMEEAWEEAACLLAERDRLGAERGRLRVDSRLVVLLTARAIYGEDVRIDWVHRTVTPYVKEGQP